MTAKTQRALVLATKGSINNLELKKIAIPKPHGSQILVRHFASSINGSDYREIMGFSNRCQKDSFIPGSSGIGIVTDIGPDCKLFKKGDKVVYSNSNTGAFAEYNVIPESIAMTAPKDVSDVSLVTNFSKGMSASILGVKCFLTKKSMIIGIFGACSGVGIRLMYLVRALGAKPIGFVESDEKKNHLLTLGFQDVINYHDEDLEKQILTHTDHEGFHAIFNDLANHTVKDFMKYLKYFGATICYDNILNREHDIDFDQSIMKKSSLYVAIPQLHHYVQRRIDFIFHGQHAIELCRNKIFPSEPDYTFKLKNIKDALIKYQEREIMKSPILIFKDED
jgi:NADPH2:quinone reductase